MCTHQILVNIFMGDREKFQKIFKLVVMDSDYSCVKCGVVMPAGTKHFVKKNWVHYCISCVKRIYKEKGYRWGYLIEGTDIEE